MRIAITYDNGQVGQHFGHAKQFKLFDIDVAEKKILNDSILEAGEASGHTAIVGLLFDNEVSVVLCGGIGRGAQLALAQAGIAVYGGISGDVDDVMVRLLEDRLEYDPNPSCSEEDNCGFDEADFDCGGDCGACGGCEGCGDGCDGCAGCDECGWGF